VRLRPNFMVPVAQNVQVSGQPLWEDSTASGAVAVTHEHGLDRAPVVRVEERLDRPVARLGLMRERQRRVGHSLGQVRPQRRREVRHLVEAAGPARGPLPHLLGAEGGLARIGERRFEEREVHGPRVERACASPSSSPTPVSPPAAAEEIIRAGRSPSAARSSPTPARDVDEPARSPSTARLHRRGGPRRAHAQQAAGRRLDGQGHARAQDRRSTSSRARLAPVPGRAPGRRHDGADPAHQRRRAGQRLTHPRFEVPRPTCAGLRRDGGARRRCARCARASSSTTA
jgi:hypothetical protein